jgi:ParB family chromosome partitioning protein
VNLSDTLHKAAGQVHYQGVAVPYLAARRDVPALAAVANNRALSEETRLGAVEGLAAAASEPGEKQLEQIGRGLENPEALRKAAWRGLRRSRRARKQAEAAT